MSEGRRTSIRLVDHEALKTFAAANDTTITALVNESIQKNPEIDLNQFK